MLNATRQCRQALVVLAFVLLGASGWALFEWFSPPTQVPGDAWSAATTAERPRLISPTEPVLVTREDLASSGPAAPPTSAADSSPTSEDAAPAELSGALYDCNTRPLAFTPIYAEGARATFAYTDRNGSFTLPSVTAGHYAISFASADLTESDTRIHLGQVTLASGERLRRSFFLAGCRMVTGVFLFQPEGLSLIATAFDKHDNTRVASARLTNLWSASLDIEGVPTEDGKFTTYAKGRKSLDDDLPETPYPIPRERMPGYFRFEGLRAGVYRIEVYPDMVLPPDMEPYRCPIVVDVDLTHEDVDLPDRMFTWADFGLRVGD